MTASMIRCVNCGNTIASTARTCVHCGHSPRQRVSGISAVTASVTCKQCGAEMVKTKRSEHNYGVQLLAVALFLVGVALLFLFPIGTLIGIFIMLGSGGLGYKRRKVWLCRSCGYFFERA